MAGPGPPVTGEGSSIPRSEAHGDDHASLDSRSTVIAGRFATRIAECSSERPDRMRSNFWVSQQDLVSPRPP